MISELRLRNFKAFGDKVQKAPMSKITLIYGPNSGGKSSIIQALLMLKQSLGSEWSSDKRSLMLRGEYVDLGGFLALIYKHNKKSDLGIGVTFLADNQRTKYGVHMTFVNAKESSFLSGVSYQILDENDVLFDAKLKYESNKNSWDKSELLIANKDSHEIFSKVKNHSFFFLPALELQMEELLLKLKQQSAQESEQQLGLKLIQELILELLLKQKLKTVMNRILDLNGEMILSGRELGRELGLKLGRELGLKLGRELGLKLGRELGLKLIQELIQESESAQKLGLILRDYLGEDLELMLNMKKELEKLKKNIQELEEMIQKCEEMIQKCEELKKELDEMIQKCEERKKELDENIQQEETLKQEWGERIKECEERKKKLDENIQQEETLKQEWGERKQKNEERKKELEKGKQVLEQNFEQNFELVRKMKMKQEEEKKWKQVLEQALELISERDLELVQNMKQKLDNIIQKQILEQDLVLMRAIEKTLEHMLKEALELNIKWELELIRALIQALIRALIRTLILDQGLQPRRWQLGLDLVKAVTGATNEEYQELAQIEAVIPTLTQDLKIIRGLKLMHKLILERELERILDIIPTDIPRTYNDLLKSITYLGPLRRHPERFYPISGEDRDSVGVQGEFISHMLYHNSRIIEEVNEWFKHFEIPYRLVISNFGDVNLTGESVSIALHDDHTETLVTLADVGFGINQSLPVIIEGIASPPNAIICVEQPEIHLHPRLQANIADLMIKTSKVEDGKQWIVETHSELLILRLQRRIREGELKSSDVSVLYVDPSDDGSKIEVLKLDENGDFQDEWPHGFFDEGFNELMAEAE